MEIPQDAITNADQGVIEGAIKKIQEGINIVGAKSDQGQALAAIISDIQRNLTAGNLEGIRQIFKEMQDPENMLMKEIQTLVDFSESQIIKNAGDEFGKGMSALVSKSTYLKFL